MIRALSFSWLLLIAASPQQAVPSLQDVPSSPPKKGPKPPCCDEKGPKPWPGYNKGVQWVQAMDSALKKARDENRILMVFQLVGDLDKEGC